MINAITAVNPNDIRDNNIFLFALQILKSELTLTVSSLNHRKINLNLSLLDHVKYIVTCMFGSLGTNAFRMDCSNLLFAMTCCACVSIAFMAGIFSWSVISNFLLRSLWCISYIHRCVD
jgi:hypothetical protein